MLTVYELKDLPVGTKVVVLRDIVDYHDRTLLPKGTKGEVTTPWENSLWGNFFEFSDGSEWYISNIQDIDKE